MNRKLRIYKNLAANRIELRYFEFDRDDDLFALMPDGSMKHVGPAEEIPCFTTMPYNTQIETDIFEKEHRSLLKQKHEDKESHIQNLNEILLELIRK